MSTLVLVEYLSLDGVAQAPGHDQEDQDGGFVHGGWAGPHLPDHREYGTELYQNASAFVFGRRTYDIWLPHWPNVTDPHDHIAHALNTRPKYVASTTLSEATWPGTTIWTDHVPEQLTRLKNDVGDGHILVPGSTDLARTLIEHDLVDAYQLWIHPFILGAGKGPFSGRLDQKRDLRLVTCTTTRTGLAVLTYESKP
jgi:dihydrofolate reductase